MSNILNTMFCGDTDEVMEVLDAEELTVGELRAALHNAFSKIAQLEKTVRQMQANAHTHGPNL